MDNRSGEKWGWIGGFFGATCWILAVALILLTQGEFLQGLIGLVLYLVAVTVSVGCAPWRNANTRYWKLMLASLATPLDHAVISVRYPGEITVGHTLALYSVDHVRFLDVLGTEGHLRVYYDDGRVELLDREHRREPIGIEPNEHPEWRTLRRHSGTPEMYDALVTHIRAGTAPEASGEAGLEAVRVGVAAEQAIRTGTTVSIQTT